MMDGRKMRMKQIRNEMTVEEGGKNKQKAGCMKERMQPRKNEINE